MFEHQKDGGERFVASAHALQKKITKSEVSIQLQALVSRIDEEIIHCKQQKEKYPRMQLYADKVSVLHATKSYLCGNIGFDLLEEYMRVYPKWDKSLEKSNAKTLIHEAIAFKSVPQ
ncbi:MULTISPECIES: hypothetical protein [Legionella]|uniref:hypothetical protein n=1 Tax=Legionella TaxID=445 RepID=UPI0009689215|nr:MULTISPECIES: hypothetical protein [Legionella]MBN9227560.1 hypothetical protein [Legionella steelei]OJW05885.1 MAG: hypothetical protein BGO44_12980 [Legionella sp. 39-23]